MEVTIDESYEAAASEWQYQIILILKETLINHYVDESKIEGICGDFVFDVAMQQDKGQIEVDGIELRPVICFDNFQGRLIYNSNEDIHLHDYAFGNTSQVFEEQK